MNFVKYHGVGHLTNLCHSGEDAHYSGGYERGIRGF